jgi:serine/threonine-protein kinase HipA
MSAPLPLEVGLCASHPALSLARLAWAGRRAALEWSASALEHGVPPDPLLYPLERGVIEARSGVLEGLHGFLADSLPDAWGRRMMRRRLRRQAIEYDRLDGVAKLAHVGHRGRGALVYGEARADEDADDADLDLDLDRLASAARAALGDEDAEAPPADLRQVELFGSASGGARPKLHLKRGGADWLVKFPAPEDPPDIGPMEQAYAEMARAAQIEISETRLLPSRTGPGHFATRRFDRTAGGGRVHMVSLCGALEAPPGQAVVGYDGFLRAIRAITRNEQDVAAGFRRMVFNILACNRDDHSRQHAFLQEPQGAWRLSPAFDLTFSVGPGGEHDMDVDGEGRRPTRAHVERLGARHGIKAADVRQVIEVTRAAVARWGAFASAAGVTRSSMTACATALARVATDFD